MSEDPLMNGMEDALRATAHVLLLKNMQNNIRESYKRMLNNLPDEMKSNADFMKAIGMIKPQFMVAEEEAQVSELQRLLGPVGNDEWRDMPPTMKLRVNREAGNEDPTLKINVVLGGSAFESEMEARNELYRLLSNLALQIACSGDVLEYLERARPIMDVNGHRCGTMSLEWES